MRVHNVICFPTRPLENLESSFQIVYLRPETQNIDEVYRVAELAQLLYLLIHERSVSWSIRRGIHVGDTEDSHVSVFFGPKALLKLSPLCSTLGGTGENYTPARTINGCTGTKRRDGCFLTPNTDLAVARTNEMIEMPVSIVRVVLGICGLHR